jgi:hypothetical protein
MAVTEAQKVVLAIARRGGWLQEFERDSRDPGEVAAGAAATGRQSRPGSGLGYRLTH